MTTATRLIERLIERLEKHCALAPFQRRFVRGAFRPGIHNAVLSCPRGSGKSTLSGWLLAEALDPEGALFVGGSESVLVAGSRDQASAVFRFLRQRVGEDGYRFQDSGQRVGATHKLTNTRVRVASSDAKRAFGIVAARLILGDEPGAWQARAGSEMYDALSTSGGKNEQTFILIGTRAPGPAGGWWRNLVDDEPDPATYVQVHDAPINAEGEVEHWSRWSTIRRASPLVDFNPYLLPKLVEERRKALKSDAARRRFITFRENRPQQSPAEVLLTVNCWRAVEARPVPEAEGRPVVALDCGSSRSWSAAAIAWRNGRLSAFVLAPGVPSLAEQEKVDAVKPGTYETLQEDGLLAIDEGRRVVRVEELVDRVLAFRPTVIVCDRFRLPEVRDAVRGRARIEPRIVRWSEGTEDILATRRWAIDGNMSVVSQARKLYAMALSESAVESDDDGNLRSTKLRGRRSRDDLARALTLAGGALARMPAPRPWKYSIVRAAG